MNDLPSDCTKPTLAKGRRVRRHTLVLRNFKPLIVLREIFLIRNGRICARQGVLFCVSLAAGI